MGLSSLMSKDQELASVIKSKVENQISASSLNSNAQTVIKR